MRVPLVLILPAYFGYQGIFWGGCVDWGIGAIMAFAWYKTGRWKKKIAITRMRHEEGEQGNREQP
jgi:Na+-driven multidrug efflux pump